MATSDETTTADRIVDTDLGPARVLALYESLTGPMYYVEILPGTAADGNEYPGGLRLYIYVAWCRERYEC